MGHPNARNADFKVLGFHSGIIVASDGGQFKGSFSITREDRVEPHASILGLAVALRTFRSVPSVSWGYKASALEDTISFSWELGTFPTLRLGSYLGVRGIRTKVTLGYYEGQNAGKDGVTGGESAASTTFYIDVTDPDGILFIFPPPADGFVDAVWHGAFRMQKGLSVTKYGAGTIAAGPMTTQEYITLLRELNLRW